MPLVQRMVACACVVMGSEAIPVAAQSADIPGVHVASAGYTRQVQTAPKNALDTKVTIDLSGVTLQTALADLMRRTNVRVSYSPLVVPMDREVSVRGTGISLGDALKQVLQGTSTEAVVSSSGQVVLVRATAKPVVQTGIIVGKVVNGAGKQPIVGATILLNGESAKVVTGPDGTFRLTAPAGTHTVQVRSLGFVRQSRTVTVKGSETVSVDFVLEASTSVLNEVVVTGTVVATERKEIPTPITVITADDIEKRGITRVDQLFRGEVPGVLSLDRGDATWLSSDNIDQLGGMVTSQVFSRGASHLNGEANPLKTYIDGVEVLDPSYLGTIDPASIERIEIITGPQASTIYGSGALGGVMQIFTKRGSAADDIEVTLTLRSGGVQSNVREGLAARHNHTVMLVGSSGPALSYSANASYAYTGPWQPDLFAENFGGSIGARHIRGAFTANGSFSLTRSRNGTSVRSSGSGYGQALQNGFSTGEYVANSLMPVGPTQKVAVSSAMNAGLTVDFAPSAMWSHHVTLGRNQAEFHQNPLAPLFVRPQDSLFLILGSTGTRTSAGYHSIYNYRSTHSSLALTMGINGSTISRTGWQGMVVNKNDRALIAVPSTDISRPWAVASMSVQRLALGKSYGGFSSLRIGLFDRLYVTLGIRGEYNSSYGREHKIDWTPTNGLAYTFEFGDVSLKLLGSYGRTTRAPSEEMRQEVLSFSAAYIPSQYISQRSNEGLTPEYARGPQGGFELYWGNRASLSINTYRQVISDLIQRNTVDSFERQSVSSGALSRTAVRRYENTAQLRQQGVEGTGSFSVARMTVKGTWSWMDSRIMKVNTGAIGYNHLYPGRTFNYVPTHSAHISLSYAHGQSSVSLITNVIGSSVKDNFGSWWWSEQYYGRMKQYSGNMKAGAFDLTSPGYSKSDLVISRYVNSMVSLSVNVTNLGNSFGNEGRMYESTAIGRVTTLGVSVRMP